MLKQTIVQSITATAILAGFSMPIVTTETTTPAHSTPIEAPSEKSISAAAESEKAKPANPTPVSTTKTKTPQTSTLKIASINLEAKLGYETLFNVQAMEQKLLQGPVVESKEASALCSKGQNAYIYGHSEPATSGTEKQPGVYAFARLNELNVGDKIEVFDKQGQKCTYQVKKWERINTNSDGSVSLQTFKQLVKPDTGGESWLTLQTCDKNDLTGRLILRASLIE